MPRAHADSRVSDQIRTLLRAGALGSLTDGQLLDHYLSPDGLCSEMAFAALVERHGPMILGVCRRLLTDAHVAEDAFQATFLVLAQRAKSVRNQDSLGGWLHRVARRIALRLRSTHARRLAREQTGNHLEVAVRYVDRVEHEELRSVIDQEIDRLAESHRLPVVLCCLEGISHEEAAQRLRWPLGTVKSRLARARKRLQERLVRKGFAPSAALSAAGTGSLAGEASAAAVPPALVDATAKAAAAVATGVSLAGMVPASLSALVQEESSSMIATKLRLAVGIPLATVASTALVGFVLDRAAAQKEGVAPVFAIAIPSRDQTKGAAEAPTLAAKLSAAGTVVDEAGRPVAGVRVILREWSEYRVRGMASRELEKLPRGNEEIRDTLMETTTDDAGRFRFHEVPAAAFPEFPEAGQSIFPWDVVALKDGHALAWTQLTPHRERTPITMTLGPEGILRGRVVEPGGKPVVGARVKVLSIDPLGKVPDDDDPGRANELNLHWSAIPLGATTDSGGRFNLGGLSRDRMVTLSVTESRHERILAYAATSDQSQSDLVSKLPPAAGFAEVREPVHTGAFMLTTKLAEHVLTGRVVFESDGKPAARTWLWLNQIDGRADENGRFRLEGLAAGKLDLHAILDDSDAAPLNTQIEIPETPREIEHDLILPRGLVVRGRVVDATTGRGVPKATVDFRPTSTVDQIRTFFDLSRETDLDGRFRLALPPGRGTVFLRTFPTTFRQPERQSSGQPIDPELNRDVSGAAGQTIEVADIRLSRGREVVLRVVDLDGRPVANALFRIIETRLNGRPAMAPGHSDSIGRYTLAGLPYEARAVVDIIAANVSQGAMVEIPKVAAAGASKKEIEVRLGPLVKLSGRVLDGAGNAIPGPVVAPVPRREWSRRRPGVACAG